MKSSTKSIATLVMLAGALVLMTTLSSCSTTTNRDIAESAVEKLHSQYNSELFESIEVSAAPEFKTASGKAYLERVHETLGRVKSSNQVSGSVQNLNNEAQIHLIYMTSFANGQAPETFVFRVKDKRANLIFYEVDYEGLSLK